MGVVTKVMKGLDKVLGMHSPKRPDMEKVREMPDADDQELKKKAMRDEMRRKRSGRASTIMSGGNNLG